MCMCGPKSNDIFCKIVDIVRVDLCRAFYFWSVQVIVGGQEKENMQVIMGWREYHTVNILF